MTFQKLCVLVLLALVNTGCSDIFIDKPIGEAWTRREQSKLLGRWVIEEGDGEVYEVQRAKSGTLVFGSMRWDVDSQKFEVLQGELSATHLGDNNFVFFDLRDAVKADNAKKEKQEEIPEGLFPSRIEIKDANHIEMTFFKAEALAKAIEEEKLSGEVTKVEAETAVNDDRYKILLSAEDKKVIEFFKSPEVKTCLDERAVIKWKRMAKEAAR